LITAIEHGFALRIREEIRVLREQFGGSRVRLDDNQRRRLASISTRDSWVRVGQEFLAEAAPFVVPAWRSVIGTEF
jgi:hypothetical protein